MGGAVPKGESLKLDARTGLKTEYFLERRGVGIFNIGRRGYVDIDGKRYVLDKTDCLYVGRGSREVIFASEDPAEPSPAWRTST